MKIFTNCDFFFYKNAGFLCEVRGRAEMEAVDVHGFNRRWRMSCRMRVEEAMTYITIELGLDPKDLVMERVQEQEVSLVLSRAETLEKGHTYRIRRMKIQTALPRRFGSVVPYYVPPNTDAIVQDLTQGKYCILTGSPQSGKTTLVIAAMERVSLESDACIVYLGGLTSADASWDRCRLWGYIWDSLHMNSSALFKARSSEEQCDELQILSLFAKEHLRTPVTVVLDEADSLLNLSTRCIDEFFHVIRMMKDAPDVYNLHGFLLVGTECVRDLLEAQYDKRAAVMGRDYEAGSSPSRLSPFPHDHVLSSTKFSPDDVRCLLNQAAADRSGVIIDVEAIAASIMQWTWGHKGLTGTCLAYLVQEELWKFEDWIKNAESYHLGTYIFGQATYNRIMQYVREHVHNEEVYTLLVNLLETEELNCEYEMVVKLRQFIGQGVLVAMRAENGRYVICLSSPLLRTAILRRCAIVWDEVDPPPNARCVDRKWLILQAIRSLDGETICRQECLNAHGEPSEYAYQFLFMCRIKAVIRQAYPSIGARVLPEAKEVIMHGRRRSQLRLDTLVRDGDNFSKFGFELVANGSRSGIAEHLERAVRYHELHSAQVFVLHFYSDKAREQLINPCHDSVVFVSVYFNISRDLAEVTFIDVHGTTEVLESPLKKWRGKISFTDL